MRKRLLMISTICFFGVIFMATFLFAANYKQYEKKGSELKVGKVRFSNYTIEELLEEKEEIEEQYQQATDEYNKDLTRINKLITEARRLGL